MTTFNQKHLNVDNLSRLNSVRNIDDNGMLMSQAGAPSAVESNHSRLTRASVNLLGKSNSVAKIRSIIDQKQLESHLGMRNGDEITTTLKRTIDLVPKDGTPDQEYDSKRASDALSKKSRRSVCLNTMDQTKVDSRRASSQLLATADKPYENADLGSQSPTHNPNMYTPQAAITSRYSIPNLKDQISLIQSGKGSLTTRKEKLDHDLKSRLKTTWRKVYRDIVKYDHAKTNQIPCKDLINILHRQECFVSREELFKIF